MDSERIPCGLPTVTSPPKGQASEYDKKYFLTLDSLWLATGNINKANEPDKIQTKKEDNMKGNGILALLAVLLYRRGLHFEHSTQSEIHPFSS